MLASLDQSLRRMGLDYVDIFYSHRFDPDTPLEETAFALATAVQQGKALYVGISAYSPEQTLEFAALLRRWQIPLLIHQPKYNIFVREIEAGLFAALDEVGAGMIAFSPLAQGLLTDRYLTGEIPTGSRAATSPTLPSAQITGEYLNRARALNTIAENRGQTLAQLALSWILRRPEVTSALIGASSVAQLEQNVATVSFPPLTDAELAAIEPLAQPLP